MIHLHVDCPALSRQATVHYLPLVERPVPTVAEVLQQGKLHHSAGQLADAVRCYQAVVQADPANFDARYLLGAALHSAGQLDPANLGQSDSARSLNRRVSATVRFEEEP